MWNLVLACLFFLAIHYLVAGTMLRDTIVARVGEKPYMGLFSLASLAAIIWMSWSYGQAPHEQLWLAGPILSALAVAIMLPALGLAVLAFASPNPTAAGGDKMLARDNPARGVFRITRHPFLWGAALWSLAHIIFNGHLAALIFFATFGLLALLGARRIDARKARLLGAEWERFAAQTSWLPFAAIVQGRATFEPAEIGWWRLILALAVYIAVLLAHGVGPI